MFTQADEEKERAQDAPSGRAQEEEEGVQEGEEEEDGVPTKKRKKAWRVMLAPSQAVEIYRRRPPLDEVNGKYTHGSMRNASAVAVEYKVSPKTIRDIWNRYSWAKVTRPMWTEQEGYHYSANYVLRGHQGSGSSMRTTVACGAAANKPIPTPHHAFIPPSPYLMGGAMGSQPIQLEQQPSTMISLSHPAASVHQQPQPQQQGVGAAPHAWGYSPGVSNTYTEMLQSRGAPVENFTRPRTSSVDDIGFGSEQMHHFNQEVDQMVGFPTDIFPKAAAATHNADFMPMPCKGMCEGPMISYPKPSATKSVPAPSGFDFPGSDPSVWDAPFAPALSDNSFGFSGEDTGSSDCLTSRSSNDLYEQMYRSEKRLNDLLNMNGLPAYNGGAFCVPSSAACPPPPVF